jgi:hypothetical protein
MTWSNHAVVDTCVAGPEWQMDFARIYAACESCTPGQAGRAAAILCESLCQLPPLEAARTVLADADLLAALRIATREGATGLTARRSDSA